MLIIGVLHIYLIKYLCLDAIKVNKAVSLSLQIIGGLLILYSIDSNISTYRGGNIFSHFLGNLKKCPLFKQDLNYKGNSVSISLVGGKGDWSIAKTGNDIEYLQSQIDQLKRQFIAQAQEHDKKAKELEIKLRAEISETSSEIESFKSKVVEANTNGLSFQVFGVLLMIYGGTCGYFA